MPPGYWFEHPKTVQPAAKVTKPSAPIEQQNNKAGAANTAFRPPHLVELKNAYPELAYGAGGQDLEGTWIVEARVYKNGSVQDLRLSKEGVNDLKRRGYEMSYFEGAREVDFIAKRSGEEAMPVQVTWELLPANRDREIEGLAEACKVLDLGAGLLLTNDQEEEIRKGDVKIIVRSAWKWMIEESVIPFS